MGKRPRALGFLMVILAASFWGAGGTVAQRLFQDYGVSVEWFVTTRLLIGGIIFLILCAFTRHRKQIFLIWKDSATVPHLIIYGLFGMLAVQYTFMASVGEGNAAVATLLQYLAPVFIIFYLIMTKKSKLKLRELIAVAFALTGCYLLLTNGSFQTLSVPVSSIIWGLLSGIALAFYTLYAVRLLKQWNSLVVIGWTMLIGGVSLSFFHPPWSFDPNGWTSETFAYLIFVLIFATIIAFWFYIESLKILTPQEASILGTVEPLVAIASSVLWLHVSFSAIQGVGAAMILFMVIFLTVVKDEEAGSLVKSKAS